MVSRVRRVASAAGAWLDAAQYRLAFHLSVTTPSVSAGTSELFAAHTRRRVEAGQLPPPPPPPAEAEKRREIARRRISPGRSLGALRPDLAAELHPARNGELDPFLLGPSSLQKLWWRCEACGHEWQTSCASRVAGGYGCPRCAVTRRAAARRGTFAPGRSLAALHPGLAAELRDLDPGTLGPGSRTRAWWRCGACGQEWEATIKQRVAGRGCPRCARAQRAAARRRVSAERSLALYPAIAAELDLTHNGDLDPFALGVSTRQEVWWRCPDCGEEWRARVRDRTAGSGCPRCARARASATLRARAAAGQ